MAINSVHPAYSQYKDNWELLHDFYEGEQHVKSLEDKYLLPTPGMLLDGMGTNQVGRNAYDNYLARAVFPDYIKDAVEIAIGLLHSKPPVINLPPELESLRLKSSNKKEPLVDLLRRINVEQLTSGRVGLMLDVDVKSALPYFALYKTENAINWDESGDFSDTDELNLVVLDETSLLRTSDFDWKINPKHRVLQLLDGVYYQGVFEDNDYDDTALIAPAIRGRINNEIPFVFINSKDLLPQPDNPPLLGLANTTHAIYRGEADYRQSLFMQSQDTLVVIGSVRNPNIDPTGTDAIRTGAGSRIDLDVTGDAKYIGVSSKGLPEQRTCLTNDRLLADTKSGRFIGNQANVESGRSLSVRLGAQTATLNQIAITGAAGLERLLKNAAVWVGADPELVKVIPNMDFTKVEFQGQELVNVMTARGMGAPLSLESIHNTLVDRGMTTLDYEAEIAKIAEENMKMNIPEPNAGNTVPKQPNQMPTGTKMPLKTESQNTPQ